MTGKEPQQTTNLDRYGNPAVPWSRALAALAQRGSADIPWFLSVTDPDGSPHVAGIGALWADEELYFVSGPGTRKSKDLAAQPAACISVRLNGIDLVFEGTAGRVTDRATLDRVAELYRQGGWPVSVEGEGFTAPYNAPSAGPPPWYLFRLDYDVVYGVSTTEPGGAARWRFSG